MRSRRPSRHRRTYRPCRYSSKPLLSDANSSVRCRLARYNRLWLSVLEFGRAKTAFYHPFQRLAGNEYRQGLARCQDGMSPSPPDQCSGVPSGSPTKRKKTLRMAPKGLDRIHNVVSPLEAASEAIPNATEGSGLFPLDYINRLIGLLLLNFSNPKKPKPFAAPTKLSHLENNEKIY